VGPDAQPEARANKALTPTAETAVSNVFLGDLASRTLVLDARRTCGTTARRSFGTRLITATTRPHDDDEEGNPAAARRPGTAPAHDVGVRRRKQLGEAADEADRNVRGDRRRASPLHDAHVHRRSRNLSA
jgi:hypothetical protein